MVGLIEQLLDMLTIFRVQYGRLLSTTRQEQEAAQQWDVGALTDATVEKEALIAALERQERQRSDLMKEIAGQLKLPSGGLTLSVLARNLADPWRARLEDAGKSLLDVIGAVREANKECRLTVTHGLSLVRHSLSYCEHLKGISNGYGSSGMISSTGGGGRLISGAV